MTTTTLIAEILIVGLSFFLNIIPIITLVFGISPEEIIIFYSSIQLPYQITAAYAFGVIWNRFCDQILKIIDVKIINRKISKKEYHFNKKKYQFNRIRIVVKSKSMGDYLLYIRSLIRISRAVFVFSLIYLVTIPFIGYLDEQAKISIDPANKLKIMVALLLLCFMSSYQWSKLSAGYLAAITDAIKVINKTPQQIGQFNGRKKTKYG